MCIYADCKTIPVFNFEGETKRIYCNKHKTENMIDVKNKFCIEPNCKIRPSYNIEGDKKALYCYIHKLVNMVNIVSNLCIEPNCKTQPIYNIEGNKKALYCSSHKKEGMVNVKTKQCIELNCKIKATYNIEGQVNALYCTEHKKENMVNILSKTCEQEGCKIHPSYNIDGLKNARFCSSHKKEGMINIKNKFCKTHLCSTSVQDKYEGYCLYCFINMFPDIRSKICIHEGCKIHAHFNFKNQVKLLFCFSHKKDGMVDIKNKTCKNDWCSTQIKDKYEGYCLYCFINMFPDKPVSRNYKTKERATVEHILNKYPELTWTADKVVKDGCSKRRPDLLLDLGYQIIIIEVDENQHTDYDCSCENKRIMELSQDLGHRPIIFIRFNPDDYLDTGNTITSCWSNNKNGICTIKKSKQDEWIQRLNSLTSQLDYWIDPVNKTNKTIETVQLFYDI